MCATATDLRLHAGTLQMGCDNLGQLFFVFDDYN